jgi:hypothetical protein
MHIINVYVFSRIGSEMLTEPKLDLRKDLLLLLAPALTTRNIFLMVRGYPPSRMRSPLDLAGFSITALLVMVLSSVLPK